MIPLLVSHSLMVCGETDKWPVFVQVRRFHDVTSTHKRQMLVKYASRVNGVLEWCVGFMSELLCVWFSFLAVATYQIGSVGLDVFV